MRIIGRVRLSQHREESTSIIRQKELVNNWAEANGHTVVGWAEDIDVSGSVSPFDAPGLSPWLSERSHEWDILVAWKLDRLARNSVQLHRLFGWIQDNDKHLVCVSDNIDLSTWVGRLVAGVIAGVAEGELEAIRERLTASRKKLRELGRYAGGKEPYGYQKVQRPDGGWELEHNPEQLETLHRIIRDVISGKPLAELTRELNSNNVPAPLASNVNGWSHTSLANMLRSKTLLGYLLHDGKPVLDAEGKPVLRGPAIVDAETFNQIQTALDQRSFRSRPHQNSKLVGVLRCPECKTNLTIKRGYRNDKLISEAYRCRKGCLKHSITAKSIEALVYQLFSQELGGYEIMERRITPGNNTAAQLQEAEEAYQELAGFLPTAPDSETRAVLFQQLTTLGERIKHLKETNTEPTDQWVSIGKTYQQHWETLDTDQRRDFMNATGIKVEARQLTPTTKTAPGALSAKFIIPPDLEERLKRQKAPSEEGANG